MLDSPAAGMIHVMMYVIGLTYSRYKWFKSLKFVDCIACAKFVLKYLYVSHGSSLTLRPEGILALFPRLPPLRLILE
jgi:hypothetical protein